jgi:hypothetical protein
VKAAIAKDAAHAKGGVLHKANAVKAADEATVATTVVVAATAPGSMARPTWISRN